MQSRSGSSADYTDLLRPHASFSKAGKASKALFLGQKHHYESQSAKKSVKVEPKAEPESQYSTKTAKSASVPVLVEDRGRDQVMSSSPRYQLEWDFAQASLLVPRMDEKSTSGGQPPWDRLYEYSTGARFKKMIRSRDTRKDIDDQDDSSGDDGDFNEKLQKPALSNSSQIRLQAAKVNPSSSFAAPDRWKEETKFAPPPVGHYRLRHKMVEPRPKSADFQQRVRSVSRLKTITTEGSTQNDDEEDDDYTANNTTLDTSELPGEVLQQNENPRAKSAAVPDDPNDEEVARLFMQLPKTNACAPSFKSKVPQRPVTYSNTPDHYTHNVDMVHPSVPSHAVPKAGKDNPMIGRPTSAPPVDIASYPHGSAYDVNIDIVKPATTGFVDFKRHINRDKWTRRKDQEETPAELYPAKVERHTPVPNFERTTSRESGRLPKDMTDPNIDPVVSYNYETSRDYVGPRTQTPNLSKSSSRKFKPLPLVDKVYDVNEETYYRSRKGNVHEFGKAPGHKDMTIRHFNDLVYDTKNTRKTPTVDMTKQVARDQASSFSTRTMTRSLDVSYDVNYSQLEPRMKGDPMIERQLARDKKIW